MGETKKVLHTDRQKQAANYMSPESNSDCVLRDTADFCGSTALPRQQLAHNIAQELVPQLHLLRDLIFGIKEHFAILNKAGEDSKGEASKKTLQLVPFPLMDNRQQEFSYSVEGPLFLCLLEEPRLPSNMKQVFYSKFYIFYSNSIQPALRQCVYRERLR